MPIWTDSYLLIGLWRKIENQRATLMSKERVLPEARAVKQDRILLTFMKWSQTLCDLKYATAANFTGKKSMILAKRFRGRDG